MHKDFARDVAVAALQWIASDAEVAGAFLGATGAGPGDLRRRAADPAFLGAVLDFVLTRDDWVLAVAAEARVPPDRVAMARALLPGGDAPHWT